MDTLTRTPASRLAIPKHFGRRPDAVFLAGPTVEDAAAVSAARLQHQAALATLDELDRRGLTIAWLGEQLGENVDHLRRKLYGQVNASLRDIAAWGATVGLDPARMLAPGAGVSA